MTQIRIGDRLLDIDPRPAHERPIAGWIETHRDDERIFYFCPGTGLYYGVPIDSRRVYYCSKCKREVIDDEVSIRYTYKQVGNKERKYRHAWHSNGHAEHLVKLVEKRPKCAAYPCPICAKPTAWTQEHEVYCSEQHRQMGFDRLMRAYLETGYG